MIYLSSVERMDNVAATSTDEGPPGKPAWEMSTAPKTALQKVFVARSVSSDLLKPGQIRAQHLAVEEQQGRQCLTMRGDRNLALVRQPGQKCLDFAAAQGCRVTHTVETDEGTNPVDISLFGS